MLKFSANIGMLFPDLPFLDRVAAAADAGFEAVEFPFPYGEDVEGLAARCAQFNLQVVLFNLPPGDWDAGQRGLACNPDCLDEFRRSVGLGARVAKALGCRRLNCLAGLASARGSQAAVGLASAAARPNELEDRTLVDNLRYAAETLAPQGIELLTEPISTLAVPGFFLSTREHALRILRAVNAGAVGKQRVALQYDIYHMHVTGELVGSTLASDLNQIGHIQLADCPGRHEPGTGEIAFSQIFELLERLDYRGWIGCEYHPTGNTKAGLAWMDGWR